MIIKDLKTTEISSVFSDEFWEKHIYDGINIKKYSDAIRNKYRAEFKYLVKHGVFMPNIEKWIHGYLYSPSTYHQHVPTKEDIKEYLMYLKNTYAK